ncbi:MAG: hypothetical protein QXY94_02540 [Archaeoglobaceae archaeon]
MWGVVKTTVSPWAFVRDIKKVSFVKQGYVLLDDEGTYSRIAIGPASDVFMRVPFLTHVVQVIRDPECYTLISPSDTPDKYFVIYNTLKKRFEVWRKLGNRIEQGYIPFTWSQSGYYLKKPRTLFGKIIEYDYEIVFDWGETISREVCQGSYYAIHYFTNISNIQFPADYDYVYLKQVRHGNTDLTDDETIYWHISFNPPQNIYLSLDGLTTDQREAPYPLTITLTLVKEVWNV